MGNNNNHNNNRQSKRQSHMNVNGNRQSYDNDKDNDMHELVKRLEEEVVIKTTESHIVSSDVLRNQ